MNTEKHSGSRNTAARHRRDMKKLNILGIVIVAGLLAAVAAVYAADEITINEYIKVANGEFDLTRNVNQYKVSQYGRSADYHIQSIASSVWEEVSVIADVSSNGYSFFRNLETNRAFYIDIGVRDVVGAVTNRKAFMRLYGSDVALLPLHVTNTLWAQAFTTNAEGSSLEVWINER